MGTESITANVTYMQSANTSWRGTGRTFVIEPPMMKRAGKPRAGARLRGDLIVARVRELQQAGFGKLDEHIIPEVAGLFGVSKRTVWNALKEDRKPGPISLGPMTIQRGPTFTCSWANNYLQSK